MKNFFLRAIPLLFGSSLVSAATPPAIRSVELYSGTSLTFPAESPSDGKAKADAGIRLSGRNLSAVAATGLGSTPFSELHPRSPQAWGEELVPRYGISGTLRRPGLPLTATLSAGTLHFSRSLSRIRSPRLTTGSALRQSTLMSPGLAPRLPGFTSSHEPAAAALTLQPGMSLPWLPAVQIAATADGEAYASLYRTLALPGMPTATLALTGARTRYGQECTESWFQKKRIYIEETFTSLEAEASLVFRYFQTSTAAAIQQRPFGGFYRWVRTQNALRLGDFALHASLFAADPDLIAAGGGLPATRLQTQVNPQYTLRLRSATLQTGVLMEADFRQTVERSPSPYADYTLRADAVLRMGTTRLAAWAVLDYSGLDDAAATSVHGSCRLTFPALTSLTTLGWGQDGGNTTVSLYQKVSPRRGILASADAGGKVAFKEGEFASASASAGLSFQKRARWLKYTARIAVSTTF